MSKEYGAEGKVLKPSSDFPNNPKLSVATFCQPPVSSRQKQILISTVQKHNTNDF